MHKRRWYKRPLFIAPLILIGIPVALVTIIATMTTIELNRPRWYENGSDFPLDRLPPSAHDVRFVPSYPFSPVGRSYEFRCTEEDYRQWVEQTRRKLPNLSDIRTEENGIYFSIGRSGAEQQVLLYNVLISDWREDDQSIYLVYNPETGTALRRSSSR